MASPSDGGPTDLHAVVFKGIFPKQSGVPGRLAESRTPRSPRELASKAVTWARDNGPSLSMFRSAVLPAVAGKR